jgi:dienelactone hydrolase
MNRILICVLAASLVLAGCVPSTIENNGDTAVVGDHQTQEMDSSTEAPAENPVIESTEIPTIEMQSTIPVEVTFNASDGTELTGMYYPPKESGAPVVVLMHQYNLNLHEWDAIALWLQNAGEMQAGVSSLHDGKPVSIISEAAAGLAQGEPFGIAQGEPWQDASWFPALPDDFSAGVFTFTFRGCENGCQEMNREVWIADAQAALEKAATMPGADASRIVTMGTSIGADGAVDACALSASRSDLRCVGVFSLSPGSYLDMEYTEAAQVMADLKIPNTCLASKGDTRSADACKSFEGEGYVANLESGYEHGIEMINPDRPSNILEMLRDFLINDVL